MLKLMICALFALFGEPDQNPNIDPEKCEITWGPNNFVIRCGNGDYVICTAETGGSVLCSDQDGNGWSEHPLPGETPDEVPRRVAEALMS